MTYFSLDKTIEIESSKGKVCVKSTDYCEYFKKHPDTFLQSKECWTCLYADFGIDTDQATESGICKYNLRVDKNKI